MGTFPGGWGRDRAARDGDGGGSGGGAAASQAAGAERREGGERHHGGGGGEGGERAERGKGSEEDNGVLLRPPFGLCEEKIFVRDLDWAGSLAQNISHPVFGFLD